MGSKGSQTVTQQQTYTPNPQIAAAGRQALTGAESAARLPFQMPVAPVAPFTPFQALGFGETLGAQGMAQPYFGAGAGYLTGSAAPVTGADVANYYNPMAANVTAQMQNIFGQQNVMNQGTLTQQAGGVGADRIAVGQANLANQQGLAAGQTYANLYQQALQAAEQQKQMMAGAGYGLAQMGPAAQGAQLQGISALMGAGGLQQQLGQAQLNALYQNQLARIAYPFQTPQYLAGITGGLAPAMGGTTFGQTTYPSPSPLAQILGVGVAGAGLMGGFGGFGGGGAKGSGFGGMANIGNNLATGAVPGMPNYATAANPFNPFTGAYGFAEGGGTDDTDSRYGKLIDNERLQELGKLIPQAEAGNPMAYEAAGDIGGSLPYQDGGVADDNPMQISFPGTSAPKIGGPTPIPQIQLQPGGGHSGLFPGQAMNMPQHAPGQQSGSQTGGGGSNLGSEISAGVNIASKVLPFLLAARGGGLDSDESQHSGHSPIRDIARRWQGFESRFPKDYYDPENEWIFPPQIMGKYGFISRGGIVNPMSYGEGFDAGGAPGDFPDTSAYDSIPPATSAPQPDSGSLSNPNAPHNWIRRMLGLGATGTPASAAPSPPAPSPAMAPASPVPFTKVTGLPSPMTAAPPAPAPAPRLAAPPSAPVNPMATPDAEQMPSARMPYPEALKQDWGQQAIRSPWMALVAAGARMATTPGPIGSVIGQGIAAGATELAGQRKALQSEEDINLKAQHLWEAAQQHLDRYTRMTPHERESLELQREHLDWLKEKTGIMTPYQAAQLRLKILSDPTEQANMLKMTEEQKNEYILKRSAQLAQTIGQNEGPGSTKETAIPFVPNQTKREAGKYYLLPDGTTLKSAVND